MELPLQNSISLAIIGCVSAGKSTLVNAILVNKMSSTKIKRTTMLPQVYIENDKKGRLTGESISSILEKNDAQNLAILNGDVELTDSTCLPLYHEIPKCYDLIDLPPGVGLNIYDIPGLNDSTTEKIYYNYIDKTYPSLDIICIVVDIEEAFNTSGSIQILKSLVENAKRHPEKQTEICIIANKCDDLEVNPKGELEFVDGEYKEMFQQIEKETAKYLDEVDNIHYQILKMSAEESFIYRIYKNDPSIELDPKLVNKFGINEFGKRTWARMTDPVKSTKIKHFFQNEDLDQSLELSGFNSFKTYIQDTLTPSRQYDIISYHIRERVKKIPRYTIEYEREITEQYNDILELCEGFVTYEEEDGDLFYDVLCRDCYRNLGQIPIGNILSNPNIYETSKQKILDTKELLHKRYLSVFQDDYNRTIKLLLNQQYEQIVERQNQNIVQVIQTYKWVNLYPKCNRSDVNTRTELNWFIEQFVQLQTNGYTKLEELIEKLNNRLKNGPYIQTCLDKPDRFIEYLENLNSKLGYSYSSILGFIQRVLLRRCACDNLVRAMYQYRLRQLDFDDYDEDFGEFLLDFMIALDRCGNERWFSESYYIGKGGDLDAVVRPYTREEKKNMMSLFEYMMELNNR